MGARRRREAMVKVILKVKNKTMLKILPFIQILYLKQQNSILRCFCGLKSEKKNYLRKRFSVLYFAVR